MTDKPIACTEEITPNIIVDYSEDGKPVGIEILIASRELKRKNIEQLLQEV